MCACPMQKMYADFIPYYHRLLIDSYTEGGAVPLRNIVDDGYIVQVGAENTTSTTSSGTVC